MIARCERCGVVGQVHEHHPTGRLAGVPYHPSLIERLCRTCHLELHAMWRVAGLEGDPASPGRLLRRGALWLGRRREGLEVVRVHVLAGVLDDLAERVEGVAG